VVDIPYFGYRPASIYFYGADDRVSQHGS